MAKRVSDKFDEHERDTATRGYPQEVVDLAKRTAKMSPFELDGLRHESGTRRAFSDDAVAHDEVQDDALSGGGSEADPHSRPTIAKAVSDPERAGQLASTPRAAPLVPLAAPIRAGSSDVAPPSRGTAPSTVVAPSRQPTIAGWLVTLLVVGVLLLVAAASAFGFVLGRRSVTR